MSSVERKLLKEAHEVLQNYWFDQKDDSYNNDDVIAIDKKIIAYLKGDNNE